MRRLQTTRQVLLSGRLCRTRCNASWWLASAVPLSLLLPPPQAPLLLLLLLPVAAMVALAQRLCLRYPVRWQAACSAEDLTQLKVTTTPPLWDLERPSEHQLSIQRWQRQLRVVWIVVRQHNRCHPSISCIR